MKKKTKFQNFGKEATQFLVGVAGQKPKAVDAANAAKAWMLRVNRIITYPFYNPSRSKVADDIALIQLDQEAEWNDLVQPICLPNPDKDSYSGIMYNRLGTIVGL